MIPWMNFDKWSHAAGPLLVSDRYYWHGMWTPFIWMRRRYPWKNIWNGVWPVDLRK